MCLSAVGYGQDTLVIDNDDLDAPIYYSARDSIYADLRNEVIHLYGNASVDNGEVLMTAGYIMIDLNASEVKASYAYDADSNKVEFPKFTAGGDQIEAHTLRYNIETKKAFIEEVAIQQDENYLHMGTAKRHENEQIHFKDGRFTTCNLDEPHYHFHLTKAVMVPDKRIVSGPMNLWINGVPTPVGLPFSVIPQMEDKAQGLIFPEITPTSQYGFGFQDLGYYLPINDNLQTTFYATLLSRGSWGLRNSTQYARRYKFAGNLNVGFQQFRNGFPDSSVLNKVNLTWTHKKDAKSSPYWSFGSNINFISDNNSQNNLDPLNENYFNNSFNSDVNLSRSFPGKPITAGAKLSLRQNSISQNVSLISPVVNVNVTRFFPFKNLIGTNKTGFLELFSKLGVTYNFEGQNKSTFADSLMRDGDFGGISDEFVNGIKQNMTVQTTAGLFKNTWKLTPSVKYGNKINFQQTRKYLDTSNVVRDSLIQQYGMAHDLSLNASLTTVLYSYYRYVGKNKPVLRHLLTPSFTYSYIPNLIEDQIRTDVLYSTTDTTEVTYSPFSTSLYSAGSTRAQSVLRFGFNNTFELKRRDDEDTLTGFKKTRIIDALSISGSYDFLDSITPLSNLSLNMRVSPLKWLNIVASGTFSPYGWDSTGAELSQYAINSNNTLGRFLSTTISTTVTLTSKEGREKLNNAINNIPQNWNADFEYYYLHPEEFLDFRIPWKVSLSHVYGLTANQNISSTNNRSYTPLQTMMVNADFSFTKRWKISTRTNFDIENLDITNSRLSLNRDMHCWTLAFHWTPIGGNKSFLLSIRSTSALFQNIPIDFRKPPSFL